MKNLGNLYILATPIGNMSDITLRALDVLKNVDIVLSEDTRQTKKLLDKYGIKKKQISYRDQNHQRVINLIFKLLREGKDIALTSDSGTPLISDPGYKLVRDLIEHEVRAIPIPGPSSVICALCSSGLPTDKFAFLGFLPKGKVARKRILKQYGSLDSSLIIFESPFRVYKLLSEVLEMLGDRRICLARELTKIHEEFVRGNVSKLLLQLESKKLRGEFVVIVEKKKKIDNSTNCGEVYEVDE